MSITMYDAIYVQNLEPPPPGAQAYAGYIDGYWPDYSAITAAYPKVPVLAISVFASGAGDCLDVETGDATIAQIYGWFKAAVARKIWRPCIYSSADNIDHIVATMAANGFPRSSYRLWSAHYGAGQHVCGPATCKLTSTACDGTQWSDTVNNGKADESILNDDFFAPPPTPSGPYRHVVPAGNTETLDGLAKSRNTTAQAIVSYSLQYLTPAHAAVLNDYMALDGACVAAGMQRPAMPVGMIYWTFNP